MEQTRILQWRAQEIRIQIIRAIGAVGVGHLGGSLSLAEVLAALYFGEMNVDPSNPRMDGRDRLVLSKGHAGPALYAALALRGYFPMEQLATLNQFGTSLPSHCDMNRTPGIDMTTGSLGQGLSCAVGMAKAAKITGGAESIYAIIGDGESQEGQIWEASMSAAQFELDNLLVFMDYNRKQIDGTTDEVMSLEVPTERWSAFGFDTWCIDGHDLASIGQAIAAAKAAKNGRPKFIQLDTVKGKGVSFIENSVGSNHNMPLSAEQVRQALAELTGGRE